MRKIKNIEFGKGDRNGLFCAYLENQADETAVEAASRVASLPLTFAFQRFLESSESWGSWGIPMDHHILQWQVLGLQWQTNVVTCISFLELL